MPVNKITFGYPLGGFLGISLPGLHDLKELVQRRALATATQAGRKPEVHESCWSPKRSAGSCAREQSRVDLSNISKIFLGWWLLHSKQPQPLKSHRVYLLTSQMPSQGALPQHRRAQLPLKPEGQLGARLNKPSSPWQHGVRPRKAHFGVRILC